MNQGLKNQDRAKMEMEERRKAVEDNSEPFRAAIPLSDAVFLLSQFQPGDAMDVISSGHQQATCREVESRSLEAQFAISRRSDFQQPLLVKV